MIKIIYINLFLIINILNAEIVINEIQPAPIAPEPEWIELFNYSDSTISYDTLYIQDATTAKPFISISLAPNQFAVVTKDTAALRAFRDIPDAVQLIYCKLAALNNTTDRVTLRSSAGITLDSAYFDLKMGKKGISFERVIANLPANTENNLLVCTSSDSATCGYRNSVSPAENDVEICRIYQNIENLMIVIRNSGCTHSKQFDLHVSLDFADELNHGEFSTIGIPGMSPNDSVEISINIDELQSNTSVAGTVKIHARLDYDDAKPENNFATSLLYLPIPANAVSFNEICYDASDTFSEFIELYNHSEFLIYFTSCMILNYSDNKVDTTIIEKENFIIPANSFALLAADTMIFNPEFKLRSDSNRIFLFNRRNIFNNTEDRLSIIDPNGVLIDSVAYNYHLQNSALFPLQNRSLEKKSTELASYNPLNWKSCLDILLSTPLRANGGTIESNEECTINLSANPFRKSVDKSCVLKITSAFESAYYSIKIIDIQGNCISIIRNLGVIGTEAEIDIAAHLSNLEIGAYILKIEMTDTASGDYSSVLKLFAVGME